MTQLLFSSNQVLNFERKGINFFGDYFMMEKSLVSFLGVIQYKAQTMIILSENIIFLPLPATAVNFPI